MKDDAILSALEEAAQSMSVKVQYDDLRKGEVNTAGGIFRLKDETRILIHKGLTTEEKVEKLITLFASLDTEAVHLPPVIRKRLEEAPAQQIASVQPARPKEGEEHPTTVKTGTTGALNTGTSS